MRIAIFSEVFPPKIDGITNRLRHTLACLEADGHEVLVFAPTGSTGRIGKTRVVRIDGPPFPLYPGLRVALPDPRILWELGRFRPDVVHAVGPVCLGVWGVAAARLLQLPLVASYHTDLPRYLPGHGLGWLGSSIWTLIRAVHGQAHVNLAPSSFTCRELEAHGIPAVGCWRGGVDTTRFHPEKRSLATRLELMNGCPVGPLLLSVGRLSPEKNLGVFVQLLAELPDAHLALVGDGPGRAELERRLAPRVAEGRVHFAGFLHGEALARAYASADAFVMPSTTETLGFVVLEAMSSGLPVVAARAGGIPDLVRHEETGLLYHPDHPEHAVWELRNLLAHEGQRRFYGRLGRKEAERSSWPVETRRLVDAYRKAIVLARQSRGALRRAGELLLR
jgi:glycosyltransferase involved in cell wall biosynthesis